MSYTASIDQIIKTKVFVDGIEEIDISLFSMYQEKIRDEGYFNFIKTISNGGFFCNRSLHFYSFIPEPNYLNIDLVNRVFLKEFGDFAKNTCTIGQDVFGNQYVYDLKNRTIAMFNIETADTEKIADNFESFINVLSSDIEYYSGENIILNWDSQLEFDQRLCPKKPFVIGGEYKNENLYACTFPKYFEFFADLAKQIHELPDGTPVKIKII